MKRCVDVWVGQDVRAKVSGRFASVRGAQRPLWQRARLKDVKRVQDALFVVPDVAAGRRWTCVGRAEARDCALDDARSVRVFWCTRALDEHAGLRPERGDSRSIGSWRAGAYKTRRSIAMPVSVAPLCARSAVDARLAKRRH